MPGPGPSRTDILRPDPRSPARSRWLFRVVALALGCAFALVGLCLTEATLAWRHPDAFELVLERARRSGQPLDRRPRMAVVRSLREQGRDAVPRIVPAALLEPDAEGQLRSRIRIDGEEILPLAGIAATTTVLCAEGGPYAIYESDRHGFRNPPSSFDAAPVALALVGDSFTLGECVGEGDTIADRLRETWPDVVNLGYGGDSPLLELATLVEYGAVLRPSLTLWLYFENDLSAFDIERSARSPLLMRYLEPGFSQGLPERQPAIDAALRVLVDERVGQPDELSPVLRFEAARPDRATRLRSALVLARTRRWLAGRLELQPVEDRSHALALFERVLVRAQAEVGRYGGELVVVYLPGAWNFDVSGGVPHWAGSALRQAVLERVRARGIAIVDVHAALQMHEAPLTLYAYPGHSALGSPHFNAQGYAFAAELIRAELTEHGAGEQAHEADDQ